MQGWHDSYRGKTEGHLRLGYPRRRERSMVLPGVRKLLPTVRPELCSPCGPLDIIDEEGRGVAMGALSTVCLSTVIRSFVHYASFAIPDPKLPYTIVVDASGIAASGVLMQDKGNGLQPLAFLSRQLKPTEQRYSAYERELAVVAYCLQSWRHYLEGCPSGVTVVTDHQPLVRIMDQQVLTRFKRNG